MRIYLGHGAGGGVAAMEPWIAGLRDRGLDAHAVALPRGRAERAVAAFEAQVPQGDDVVVGGHSFGGRVASLSAAGITADGEGEARRYAALVCLSYPLHRPGAPETAALRTAHWPRIAIPTLLLAGDRDPYARWGLLEAAMPLLPDGRLRRHERRAHALLPVRDLVLDQVVAFLAGLDG